MSNDPSQSGVTAVLIRRLAARDPRAVGDLIAHAQDRLRRLASKMLRQEPRVHRWEQTDDVLQNALLRLCRALEQVSPDSPQGFMKLAATMIRRELIDLARHHYGPEGGGAHHASDPAQSDSPQLHEAVGGEDGPLTLLQWQEFHQQAQNLPEDERAVFDLIFYQDLAQEEVAQLLGVSVPTVKRRWRSARLLLHEATGGDPVT
jgi:RNA polymerase sigma-70 factor (ECF subfamily)